MVNRLPIDELMKFVMPVTETGCWLWLGTTKDDYGHIMIDGEDICADKLSWESQHGSLQNNQRLLHKCKIRCCINPDHLTPVNN